MPASHVRLSAGREQMSDEMQAMCFFAGANSIFYGECLLTTPNPEADHDKALFSRLGINSERSVGQAPAGLDDLLPGIGDKTEQTLFYDATAS